MLSNSVFERELPAEAEAAISQRLSWADLATERIAIAARSSPHCHQVALT